MGSTQINSIILLHPQFWPRCCDIFRYTQCLTTLVDVPNTLLPLSFPTNLLLLSQLLVNCWLMTTSRSVDTLAGAQNTSLLPTSSFFLDYVHNNYNLVETTISRSLRRIEHLVNRALIVYKTRYSFLLSDRFPTRLHFRLYNKHPLPPIYGGPLIGN